MAADKIELELLEEMARIEAPATTDPTIRVVIQCLAHERSTDPDAAEEAARLAFERLRDRLSELGAVGRFREVPVSNAFQAHLTPAEIRAVAEHASVGRIVLSHEGPPDERRQSDSVVAAPRRQRPLRREPDELVAILSKKIVGQSSAIRAIVPYVLMYQAGLAPSGRPVGVFLLLGPTGTGKTLTVEGLAETLHGSEGRLLRIDCSEYQEDHEVAKLIGAPPGYVGHRETVPRLSQTRLGEVASEGCDLSIVLFDEIEKAAPALTRLLLGVLDRATLRLGDNTSVNFEKCLVFLTSNLGAREMMKELTPGFGFAPGVSRAPTEVSARLEAIGLAAVRKSFSPEFVNRIDAVVTYEPLAFEALAEILDQQIEALQRHVDTRLGRGGFTIDVPDQSRQLLIRKGTSAEYGARELRRTIHRHLTQPLAALVAGGKVEPGSRVRVEPTPDGEGLTVRVETGAGTLADRRRLALVVDDNRPLLTLLRQLLTRAGWEVIGAETVRDALAAVDAEPPSVALLDYLLPDESGVDLAAELARRHPTVQIIVMSGLQLSAKDEATCRALGFTLLQKPFLSEEVLAALPPGPSARSATAG